MYNLDINFLEIIIYTVKHFFFSYCSFVWLLFRIFEIFKTYIFEFVVHFDMFVFRRILFFKLDPCNLLPAIWNYVVHEWLA